MIRTPTPPSVLFRWWREALVNPDLPRHDDMPECGFYKRRMVKGGPWIPARIYVERETDPMTGELTAPERMVCDLNGEMCDPRPHWTHLRPISREEYDALLQRRYAVPEMLSPRNPIDITARPLWTP